VRFAQAILHRGAGLEVVWRGLLAITARGAMILLIALAVPVRSPVRSVAASPCTEMNRPRHWPRARTSLGHPAARRAPRSRDTET
jgi:hypothetical protein